ncbi:MAG: glycoside hydrolase family 15 protein [Deltaproteobacteria bacterium]|nr:glycoside hydrolase family 15 protein [Deltaproteobacteria bacterium]
MSQLDYALIGNCQISALIDKRGNHVWCCMPRFDSPSIFASLLGGEQAGFWSCLPETNDFETKQVYFRNTNIVRTEFHIKNGDQFDIIDFCPRFFNCEKYFKPTQIVRIIRPVKGNPRIRMVLSPKFDYGKTQPEVTMAGDGCVFHCGDRKLFFRTDIPISYLLKTTDFELSSEKYCILSYGEPFDRQLKFTCDEYLERTFSYWKTWVKHCTIPFEYQEAVIRSALALKLHIFEDTGAIIAATTTSIPESPKGNRTWDYRYCWLRDSYFVIGVLNQIGHFEEMERFIQFLHNVSANHQNMELQPVYGIGGETKLEERELAWLAGFKGIGPVRVGNMAHSHSQYDVFGEMVLAKTQLFFDARLDGVDLQRAFENVVKLVERAISVFELPDSGIWEFRSDMKHYLFSKLMCWTAVDRGLKIAERLGKAASFERWEKIREQIRTAIEKDGWNNELGFYTQALRGTNADAANLLMVAVNFHQPEDERYRTLVEQYEKLLTRNGYVFRYRNRDDFGLPVHAFVACSFWMIDALASIGRKEEARTMFEKIIRNTNHVGLLSEDIDPDTGELWGNFPQAYSHVGVINSAFKISKSWEEAF